MSIISKDQVLHSEDSEDDLGVRKQDSSPQRSDKSFQRYEDSPKTLQQIQNSLKQEIKARKEKNEANQQLGKFKKALQNKDHLASQNDKIALLPFNLQDDLLEATLYAYFCIRYYDDNIFRIILNRTQRFQGDRDLNQIFGKDRAYAQLTFESSYSRYRLNQMSFEIALEKDYYDVAFHFIETGQVHITWDMVRKMINRKQEYLVKQCIKYGTKFDPGSASMKKIVFAGRTAAPLEDRTIKLVDFIQVMLELRWKSKDIKDLLVNYSKKGKIDSIDLRELFLMFAVKRKIKLMSFLINAEEFLLDIQEDNFVDVIENDAYDMGVLLYREYFLNINKHYQKIVSLLVNSFSKTNGMLEAKCYLLKRFMNKMNFDQANKFLEAVEYRVNDSSKGNILILTLNVIKATCLLVELLEDVKSQFGFLSRRVFEIRQRLVKIANAFMNDVQSEEEMRFFLLEKDLDERDSLNIIYDCEIIELLRNPFAQNIVQQIWSSQYNNSHSLFTVSSVHRLLFNYNHCNFDEEENLRFYKKRDLSKYGCHGYQFQVWRYSGESRHLVSSVTTLAFVIIFHILIANHLTNILDLKDQADTIELWRQKYNEREVPGKLTWDTEHFRKTMLNQWYLRVYAIQEEGLQLCFLMHCSWMYLLQLGFDVVFATKNKRFTHLANFGNFIDFIMFLTSLVYVFAFYKGWRLNTFLQVMTESELGGTYWENYISSPINENGLLISFMIILWIKVAYAFKLYHLTGGIYAVLVRLFYQMFTYAIFYFAILFLFSVVGVVLFNDLEEFQALHTTLFTMFKACIQEYDVDKMKEARVGAFLGYAYYLSFLILNIILIINLIVARLAHTYKTLNKDRDILKLLGTLSVREVSEADDKYSAVISAPFPLNMLNLTLGSIVISMKSQNANIALLNIYYLPISIISFFIFLIYQIIALPFCYFKIIGHKFALMVKSPQGQGARTTLDRAGQAILFIIIGPVLLILNVLVDQIWFLLHIYKMDLDKSHLQVQQTTNLNRRTYKKMIAYFEQKNEQLVPQKLVAEDLRNYLDVMEGIRCMVFGRPKNIPMDKMGLYITYARKYLKQADGKKSQKFELIDEGLETKDEVVEQVVREFEVVKQVLLNNSFSVDMREIQQNSVKKKGWGMRMLFDKKTFHALLLDLERMRTVLNLKKSLFIFHIPYEGKPKQLTPWHQKVEFRITQTLKFLNTTRLLKIIDYDPAYHIKMDNINLAMSQQSPQKLHKKHVFEVPFKFKSEKFADIRQNNLQNNLQFMLNKYQNSARQIRELSDILKKLNYSNLSLLGNNNNSNLPFKNQEQELIDKNQHLRLSFMEHQEKALNYSDKKSQGLFESKEKPRNSKKVDAYNPLISQQSSKVDQQSVAKVGIISPSEVRPKMSIHFSERSEDEAQVSDEEEGDGKKFGKEEINMFKKK